jgi:hypothetical protein
MAIPQWLSVRTVADVVGMARAGVGLRADGPGPGRRSGRPCRGASRICGRPGDRPAAPDIPGPRQPDDRPISDESAAKRRHRCREALAATVRDDPGAYSLQGTMAAAGKSLFGFVESFDQRRGQANVIPDSDWSGPREEWIVYRFVSTVAGEGTTIADAVARRSATLCAERALASPAAAGRERRPGLEFPGRTLLRDLPAFPCRLRPRVRPRGRS